MTTVKMDVRVFGHSNANEIYGLLAKEMGVTIDDLNASRKATLSNDWHKIEVSGNTEKEVYKFIYFVESADEGLAEWEEDFGEED